MPVVFCLHGYTCFSRSYDALIGLWTAYHDSRKWSKGAHFGISYLRLIPVLSESGPQVQYSAVIPSPYRYTCTDVQHYPFHIVKAWAFHLKKWTLYAMGNLPFCGSCSLGPPHGWIWCSYQHLYLGAPDAEKPRHNPLWSVVVCSSLNAFDERAFSIMMVHVEHHAWRPACHMTYISGVPVHAEPWSGLWYPLLFQDFS